MLVFWLVLVVFLLLGGMFVVPILFKLRRH